MEADTPGERLPGDFIQVSERFRNTVFTRGPVSAITWRRRPPVTRRLEGRRWAIRGLAFLAFVGMRPVPTQPFTVVPRPCYARMFASRAKSWRLLLRRVRLHTTTEVDSGKESPCSASHCKLPAGKANPAPPVGPALGQHGVNIMEFCKDYNARTQNRSGQIIPAQLTIFEDRSFTFILKTPPGADLLRKAAGMTRAAAAPAPKRLAALASPTFAGSPRRRCPT